MEVSFWGVRGSTPAPDCEKWRFGGNTPCVAVRLETGGPLFILDAGTGIRELGRYLLSPSASPDAAGDNTPEASGLRAHLLFTHYHWDHVQGLPFFAPFYLYGNTFQIFGPRPQGRSVVTLQDALENLMRPPYFPAGPEELHARRAYDEIGEEQFELDGVRITTRCLNHPQGCLGYRLEAGGTTVVYATDHEPGFPSFDRAVRELARDADLLIADAQYLPGELASRFRGWGHGSWAEAVRIARDANVKHLVLFHHDPTRRDAEVDLILRDARRQFPSTWAASEQTVFSVEPGTLRVRSLGRRLSQRHPARRTVILEGVENGMPFAEEAWLENLGFHGAYVLSRHRLDLQSPVRVLMDSDGGASQDLAGARAEHNGRLELSGFVVRTQSVTNGAGGSRVEESGPVQTNSKPGKFGIAVHFPGLPDR